MLHNSLFVNSYWKAWSVEKRKIKSIWIYIYILFFLSATETKSTLPLHLNNAGVVSWKSSVEILFFLLIVLFICLACAFLFKNAHDSFSRNNKFSPIGIFNIFIVLFSFCTIFETILKVKLSVRKALILKKKNNALDVFGTKKKITFLLVSHELIDL